jgi:hypothetical protein
VRNGRISDATVVLEQFSHPFSLAALPLSAEKICGICLLFESQRKKNTENIFSEFAAPLRQGLNSQFLEHQI